VNDRRRPRDPEVKELLLETLKLVIQAEAILSQLVAHQAKVEAFLGHAEDYTEVELGQEDHKDA